MRRRELLGLAALPLARAATINDDWTDASLGRREGSLSIELAPPSARRLKVVS